MRYEKISRQRMRKLTECLSNSPGTTVQTVVKRPQCFRLRLLSGIAELEHDPDKKFLRNLDNGSTIVYESDLGSSPEAPHGKQNRESMIGKAVC